MNLVRRNRISMSELRAALTARGFGDVRTHLQSGNIVLRTEHPPELVRDDVRGLIEKRFGLDIAVLVRSGAELAEVLRRNPLAHVAVNPRRYVVTFLASDPPRHVVANLEAIAGGPETFVVVGREVYSWHPDGIGRAPLWERLADRRLGVEATSRNWATVTAITAMANQSVAR